MSISAQEVAAALFEPFDLAGLKLDNRIVMAPMTRKFAPGGVPGADVAEYYEKRAKHGVGLIITEGTLTGHPAAGDDPNEPDIASPAAVAGWAEVVRRVHAAGGRIFCQLWHAGTFRKPGEGPNPEVLPIGPSGLSTELSTPFEVVNEPMTQSDIDEAVAWYGKAAANARRIGFDGVEIHGGHGYLIDAFLWEGTNKRTDGYGGSRAARTRFATEVVTAVRTAVGPEYPVGFRFSQWKSIDLEGSIAATPQELEEVLTPLADAGVDVFHASARRFWLPAFAGSPRSLAGWARAVTGRPAITVGSVGLNEDFMAMYLEGRGANPAGLDELVRRLERGEFDLVAVGRALLSDAEWAEKVRDGRVGELTAFSPVAVETLA